MAATRQTASLFADIVRASRARRTIKMADSTGAAVTGPDLLLRTLVARRYLRRAVLGRDERYVGVLLPPSVGAAIANLALAFDRRVPVNLNYTLSAEMLDDCISRTGIRHVLTSRRFMERIDARLDAEPIFLEDLAANLSKSDKLFGALESKLPDGMLLRLLGLDRVDADELLMLVFTSGTTGVPKGVMLSFGNIEANLAQVDHVVHWTADDVVIGVLPFFHSFGSTVTLWAMATRDIRVVYHTNPLEAQVVGRLTREHGGTILPATPMFLRTYLRRCDPADFASVELVPVGAEKLPPALGEEFAATFDVDVFEGYGATEMAPLVAANVPDSRTRNSRRRSGRARDADADRAEHDAGLLRRSRRDREGHPRRLVRDRRPRDGRCRQLHPPQGPAQPLCQGRRGDGSLRHDRGRIDGDPWLRRDRDATGRRHLHPGRGAR